MKRFLLGSGLAIVTTISLGMLPTLADESSNTGVNNVTTTPTNGDVGTVIDTSIETVITGDGNKSIQTVNVTSRNKRYYDSAGNDGTVIRNFLKCDIWGNDNVCDQYSVVESVNVRGERTARPPRKSK
jgi:hypothetical protein